MQIAQWSGKHSSTCYEKLFSSRALSLDTDTKLIPTDSFLIMWWPWKPVQLDGHLDCSHCDTSGYLNNCTVRIGYRVTGYNDLPGIMIGLTKIKIKTSKVSSCVVWAVCLTTSWDVCNANCLNIVRGHCKSSQKPSKRNKIRFTRNPPPPPPPPSPQNEQKFARLASTLWPVCTQNTIHSYSLDTLLYVWFAIQNLQFYEWKLGDRRWALSRHRTHTFLHRDLTWPRASRTKKQNAKKSSLSWVIAVSKLFNSIEKFLIPL